MSIPVPDFRRGAIARVDPFVGMVPFSLAVFQYNPAEVSRTLTPPTGEARGRTGSLAQETLSMHVELDAADQLERSAESTVRRSLYPALSALEMLVCPVLAGSLASLALSRLGAIEAVPQQAPVSVLLWGIRVVPVRVTQLAIKETAFDAELKPIRADVDLSLQVVSYEDLGWHNAGTYLYLADQIRREVFSTMASLDAAPTVVSSFTP